MNRYYEQLKKLHGTQNINRIELKDYIHHQKNEVSSLLALPPDFWVVIDYIIHLTSAILRKPKSDAEKDFISVVKPVFDRYNSRIERVYRKIPDNEFFYLKKDMKSFHHLISHSINLIDKGLPHFIPSYLFIDSIDNMTVLYPLHDKSCDPGTLARGDYNTLISRYISEGFSPEIKAMIDYMLWLKTVLPHVIPDDRSYVRMKMITMIENFVSGKHEFVQNANYSTKDFVIELRDMITISYIQDKMSTLLEKIKAPGASVPISECLEHVASIFIDINMSNPDYNTARDLALITQTIKNIIDSIKLEDESVLFNNLVTARALKDFYMKVTRYMLNVKSDLELVKVFEATDFLYDNFPVHSFASEIVETLQNSLTLLENEQEILIAAHSIDLNPESVNLFRAKMRQIFAKT
ncbi:MAG TPA: hypothetical protein PKG52_09270 [bacterium]|nr:hypothetical protein [bacterium]HPS29455.1 hypothetical protein [bacterium]